MNRYRKAIVAGVGFLASVLSLVGVTLLEDPAIQTGIVTFITTVGVYFVPNEA